MADEIKSQNLIPWKRIGDYLEYHPKIAVIPEAIIYASLLFTAMAVAAELAGYPKYSRSCQIPQTQNIQGADTPERFIRVGKEIFYSRIDGKEISDLVK